MSQFTDQKSRVATVEDCQARWSFGKPGECFRCYFCGRQFEPGDIWRWVYAAGRTITVNNEERGLTNFKVCEACDGPGILDRWVKVNEELYRRFWWALD